MRSAVSPAVHPASHFVSIPDFAKRSSLSRATVYNLIAAGQLRAVKLTQKRMALTSEDVERWFASKMEAA